MSNEELINEENSVNNVSEKEVKKEVNIEDGHVLTKEELDSLSPSKALALPLNQYPEDKPLLEIKDIDIVSEEEGRSLKQCLMFPLTSSKGRLSH